MYERFTNHARKAMALANQDAQRLGSRHIGTEHMVRGIIEAEGVAFFALQDLSVDIQNLKASLEAAARARAQHTASNALPMQPDLNLAVQASMQVSSRLRHNYVGTEHLLLGVLSVPDSPGAIALNQQGITLERAEATIVKLLTGDQPPSQQETTLPESSKRAVSALVALRMEIDALALRFDTASRREDTKAIDSLRALAERLITQIRNHPR